MFNQGRTVRSSVTDEKGDGDESPEGEEGDQDLVARLERLPRDGGAYARDSRREEARADLHHREHGRAPVGRTRPPPPPPRPPPAHVRDHPRQRTSQAQTDHKPVTRS